MAAAYLSVGDIETAIIRLMKCGELFFAMELDLLTGRNNEALRAHFAKVCIVHNVCVESAFALLNDQTKRKLAPMILFAGSQEREEFCRTMGIGPFPEPTSLKDQIHAAIVGGDEAAAISMFLQFARETLPRNAWDFCEVKGLLEEMEFTRLSKCKSDTRREVLAIAFYVATFEAMWKGYEGISGHLYPSLATMIEKGNLDWMKPLQKQIEWNKILTVRQGDKASVVVQGYDEMNVITSNTTARSRRGPILYIENGGERISLLNATMWFDVTPFSPMCDGEIFYVF
jgi:hypothetical protein